MSVPLTTKPMEAEPVDELPRGKGWLYDDDGRLHFVSHSRIYNDAAEIARLLEPLKGGTGFTGAHPAARAGGPARRRK